MPIQRRYFTPFDTPTKPNLEKRGATGIFIIGDSGEDIMISPREEEADNGKEDQSNNRVLVYI